MATIRRYSVSVKRRAGARAFIRDRGGGAYGEARQRERDVILPEGATHAGLTPAHWRRVALIVSRMTGMRVGLDTAMRMLERGRVVSLGKAPTDSMARTTKLAHPFHCLPERGGER